MAKHDELELQDEIVRDEGNIKDESTDETFNEEYIEDLSSFSEGKIVEGIGAMNLTCRGKPIRVRLREAPT